MMNTTFSEWSVTCLYSRAVLVLVLPSYTNKYKESIRWTGPSKYTHVRNVRNEAYFALFWSCIGLIRSTVFWIGCLTRNRKVFSPQKQFLIQFFNLELFFCIEKFPPRFRILQKRGVCVCLTFSAPSVFSPGIFLRNYSPKLFCPSSLGQKQSIFVGSIELTLVTQNNFLIIMFLEPGWGRSEPDDDNRYSAHPPDLHVIVREGIERTYV